MATKTTESEHKQRVSNRGKNFSVAEDKQICLSWIHATEIGDTAGSSIWEILYDHAVCSEQDLKARSINGLRCRFLLIQRTARKFSDIYKIVTQDETETALEKALRNYRSNYKEHFKFLQCWEILRKNPKFLQMAETHSNALKPATAQVNVPKPELIVRTESTREKARGLKVRSDEIQALLKACHDVGVEDARSKGERIEPLLYDVQQQMATYGIFQERKLYMLKNYYLRTEKEYRNGELKPYPPEARILWGNIGNSEEDEKNDTAWGKQIQYTLDSKKGSSFLSDLEIKELLKQALERRVESVSQTERQIIFIGILSDMHAQQLCRRKNASQLLQDYLRLKKQFSSGKCKKLPSEADQLWGADEPVEIEPMPQISYADCTMKAEADELCRICQAELIDQTKHLFVDVYEGQTYAAIIQEAVNVEMANDERLSTVICDHCSIFIENLANFVQQCRENCVTNDSYQEDFTIEKIETLDFEVYDISNDDIKDEPSSLVPADFNNDDSCLMNDADILSEANDATNDDTCPEVTPAADTTEEVLDADTRRKRNYRKYLDSCASRRGPKRQCHLCGKKVIALVDHLESHSGKDFKCQFCDRICPNRRQLRVHMNRHTKKHVFPCRHCGKIFYVWSSRKNHEEGHTKSTFKCDVCDAEYKHKSYLRAHKKAIHLGIRNLKCSQCDFSTFIKARLLNHVRSMHTSERPYKCSVCEHTSNSSTGYYIHFQRHKKSGEVAEYSIRCAYCMEYFTKDAALEVHIVKNHPERAIKI